MNGLKDLLSLDTSELESFVVSLGESKFRAKQLKSWLISGCGFDEMTNLSLSLRSKLKEVAVANPVRVKEKIVSSLDGTQKYLFELLDGNIIEGVRMKYHYGDTQCVSTQVGCKMGCKFCASTLDGCVRSLTAGEILGQIIAADIAEDNQNHMRIHNIVLMGSGEPFDNYGEVTKFLRLVNDKDGLGVSLRNISLSTCGLVPQIYKFADENLPVTLSISLHAPNDEIRKQLMPIANRYSIAEILAACKYYIAKTGRRIVFEYALVDGINNSNKEADELAAILRGMQCHVNLIPLNDVKERNLIGPTQKNVRDFKERLEGKKISVTVRREMGDDIQGACGQLRRSRMQ